MSAFSSSVRIALVFALTVSSLPVHAQDKDDRAYELATQGAKLFGQGDYREAARRFEEAYALLKDSVLLKNQIVSLYKAGDCGTALDIAYQYDISYRDAPATDREDVRKVRVDCNLLAASTALEYGKLDVADDSLQRAKSIGFSGEEEQRYTELNAQLTAERTPKASAPVEVEKTTEWHPIVGWSVAGIGLAVVGVTAGFQYSDYQKGVDLGCAKTPCLDADDLAEYEDLQDNSTGYAIGYAVGGLALAGGVGLLVYHYMMETDESVVIAPAVGADHLGASLQFKF